MSDTYKLFRGDPEIDGMRAFFGRYYSRANTFDTYCCHDIIGHARSFGLATWEYELEMREANYTLGEPTVDGNARIESPLVEPTKKKPINDEKQSKEQEYVMSVLNEPHTLFKLTTRDIGDAVKQKRVCLYYGVVRNPVVINAVGIFTDGGSYTEEKHRRFAEMINRLLISNGVLDKNDTVKDLLDYYKKTSLLSLSKDEFKKVSAITPTIGSIGEDNIAYGGKNNSLDNFTKNAKKVFDDIRSYFILKLHHNSKDVKPRSGSGIVVTCTKEDIQGKDCDVNMLKKTDKSNWVDNTLKLKLNAETSTEKDTFVKNLRKKLKGSLCEYLSKYLDRIFKPTSWDPLNYRGYRMTLNLNEKDREFINKILQMDEKATLEEMDGENRLHLTTTFEYILKYYLNTYTIEHPKTTIILHAILYGIEMYCQLSDGSLRTDNRSRLVTLLHGSFYTNFYPKLVVSIGRIVSNALKVNESSKGLTGHANEKMFLAKLSKIRSDIGVALAYIKSITSADFSSLIKDMKEFKNLAKELSKTFKEASSSDRLTQMIAVFELSCDTLSSSIANMTTFLKDGGLQVPSTVIELPAHLNDVKIGFGNIIHNKMSPSSSTSELYMHLSTEFDDIISEVSFVSWFESLSSSINLDEDPKIQEYISWSEKPKKQRKDSKNTEKLKRAETPIPDKDGVSPTWLDDDLF